MDSHDVDSGRSPDVATHAHVVRVGSAVVITVFDGPFEIAKIKMTPNEARGFASLISAKAAPKPRRKKAA